MSYYKGDRVYPLFNHSYERKSVTPNLHSYNGHSRAGLARANEGRSFYPAKVRGLQAFHLLEPHSLIEKSESRIVSVLSLVAQKTPETLDF
jgi:hypothetical protein